MLGSRFEMMGSSAMVFGCVVMHFVLVCCCHDFSPIGWQSKNMPCDEPTRQPVCKSY
jgi:hypothetical protein